MNTTAEIIDFKNMQAIIFDMDGVLINSEPLWKQVEIDVFASVGIDFVAVGGEKTVGLRIDEVVSYWYNRYPWKNKTQQQVVDEIMDKMVAAIQSKGQPMKGVHELLTFLREKGVRIALASSSLQRLIEITLDKLQISDYFELVQSAEFMEYGKPHPEIYISVAKQLGISPENCLVIEDSLNGVIAGKAAKMNVIAVPEHTHAPNPKISVADVVISDLFLLEKMIQKSLL